MNVQEPPPPLVPNKKTFPTVVPSEAREGRERRGVQKKSPNCVETDEKTEHHALMELAASLRSSILNIPSSGSLGLNVLSVSCVSVNCVVVVVRKTIGPFDRDPFAVEAFEGIEYDNDWADGRVSSELMPRPMRTIISENYAEAKREGKTISEHIDTRKVWSEDYVRRCPMGDGVKGKEEKSEHADVCESFQNQDP